MAIPLGRRVGAEVLGTFWLVLGGCGSAVLAAKFGGDLSTGIGLVGVSLAFGLTVVTGAYAFGHISGGHFNPAVTVGLTVAKKFDTKDVAPYIGGQVVGAILASLVLWVILKGQGGHLTGNFLAANGYGKGGAAKGYGSPGGFNLAAGLVTEVVMTAFFLIVILGATAKRAAAGFGGLAIGLCLTLIHLISIPVTNTSVNPARSIGPALFVGGEALKQLWLFILAPVVGAALGALIHTFIGADDDDQPAMAGEAS